LYYFIAAAFTANTLSLCRSRGSFLGLAFGAIAAVVIAPKRYRKKIFVLILVGALGIVYVSDSFFIERIFSISVEQEEMDASASVRVDLWMAGAKIFADHPLGIGPGNWYQTIGHYLQNRAGRDSHNTYVKCAVELGVLGIVLFMLMLWQAYGNLKKVLYGASSLNHDESEDFAQYYFAIIVSLVIILACGLTITMLYTEVIWLLLMLPVCLRRAIDNLAMENAPPQRQIFRGNDDDSGPAALPPQDIKPQ
jgi:O-antigen ligase